MVIPFLATGLAVMIWPEMFGYGEAFILLPLGDNIEISRQLMILLAKFILLLLEKKYICVILVTSLGEV